MLNTYGIVVAAFSLIDKAKQVKFFEKTFLVPNISPEIVFGILFLTLSSADIDFLDWKFRWRTYTTKEALPTTKQIGLIKNKEFSAVALDPEYETFIIYIMSLSTLSLSSIPLNANI